MILLVVSMQAFKQQYHTLQLGLCSVLLYVNTYVNYFGAATVL